MKCFFSILFLLILSGCYGFDEVKYEPPDVISQDRYHKVDPGHDPIEKHEDIDKWEELND